MELHIGGKQRAIRERRNWLSVCQQLPELLEPPRYLWLDNPGLHVLHHRDRYHKDKTGEDLMRSQSGVEEPPRDADRGKCLHHLKITGGGSPR